MSKLQKQKQTCSRRTSVPSTENNSLIRVFQVAIRFSAESHIYKRQPKDFQMMQFSDINKKNQAVRVSPGGSSRGRRGAKGAKGG